MYSLAMLIQIKIALEGRIGQVGEHIAPAERVVAQAALELTTVLIGNHLFGTTVTPLSGDTHATVGTTEG